MTMLTEYESMITGRAPKAVEPIEAPVEEDVEPVRLKDWRDPPPVLQL